MNYVLIVLGILLAIYLAKRGALWGVGASSASTSPTSPAETAPSRCA